MQLGPNFPEAQPGCDAPSGPCPSNVSPDCLLPCSSFPAQNRSYISDPPLFTGGPANVLPDYDCPSPLLVRLIITLSSSSFSERGAGDLRPPREDVQREPHEQPDVRPAAGDTSTVLRPGDLLLFADARIVRPARLLQHAEARQLLHRPRAE